MNKLICQGGQMSLRPGEVLKLTVLNASATLSTTSPLLQPQEVHIPSSKVELLCQMMFL